jgi:hypothetical protein
MKSVFNTTVFGPYMLYNYLEQFYCLSNKGCRVLFVIPCPPKGEEYFSYRLALNSYEKLWEEALPELAVSRPLDWVHRLHWDDLSDEDGLCKAVEHYLSAQLKPRLPVIRC